MRRHRIGAALALLAALVLLFTGCSGQTTTEVLAGQGFEAGKSDGWTVEIRYLKESQGANYLHATVTEAEAVQALYQAVTGGEPAKQPDTKQFSPEYMSDCEMVFTNGDNKTYSFYYAQQNNLLIFPSLTQEKKGDVLRYLYFTPAEDLKTLLDAYEQTATMMEETAVEPFRNMEELKASIDSEELAEEGTELDFEYFDGTLPANSGTACQMYTSKDDSAVPVDSYLITAYNKDSAGKQVKLSIVGLEANTNYTKFFVSPPDEALDSVDAGQDAPNSSAVTVKRDAVDPDKWIVFLDGDGKIYDVILPEDLIVNQ